MPTSYRKQEGVVELADVLPLGGGRCGGSLRHLAVDVLGKLQNRSGMLEVRRIFIFPSLLLRKLISFYEDIIMLFHHSQLKNGC